MPDHYLDTNRSERHLKTIIRFKLAPVPRGQVHHRCETQLCVSWLTKNIISYISMTLINQREGWTKQRGADNLRPNYQISNKDGSGEH